MAKRSQTPAAQDQLLGALEAGAGMLRALEAASLALREDPDQRHTKEHVDRAIELLRAAIDEVRSPDEDESHPGAAGFIMAVRRRRRRSNRPDRPRPSD